MVLVIVLMALVIQRFLGFNSYSRRFDWALHYFQWMTSKIKQITQGHGFVGLAILVLPVVLVAAIILSLAYGFFGYLGAGILQLMLVWYCLDGRDIRKEPYEQAASEVVLSQAYQQLFAILFWYCVFGPVGLVLYITVSQLAHVAPRTLVSSVSEAEQDESVLPDYLMKTLGVLDWLPVRLLGLSFALVGSFAAVFKLWMQKLFEGIANPQALVIEWGEAALKAEKAETEKQAQLEPVINLIRSIFARLVGGCIFSNYGCFLGVVAVLRYNQ